MKTKDKIEFMLELSKKEKNIFSSIDEKTVDKLINIIKSGRIPNDEHIVEILLKLEEGGLIL